MAITGLEVKASAENYLTKMLSLRVQDKIAHEELVSAFNIKAFSEAIGISSRTIVRRLNDIESSFTRIRDEVRLHFAEEFLLDPEISMDRIRLLLGYNDRTSFTDFINRQKGCSPSDYRLSKGLSRPYRYGGQSVNTATKNLCG